MLDLKNAEACFRMGILPNPLNSFMALVDTATLAGVLESFLLAARHPQMNNFRREIREITKAGIQSWRSLLDAWEEANVRDNQFKQKNSSFVKLKALVGIKIQLSGIFLSSVFSADSGTEDLVQTLLMVY